MPTSYAEEERIYHKGFRDGWVACANAGSMMARENPPEPSKSRKSPKRKRKASAYSKRYGAIYKRLKKKHPRMSFGALSKKAHKEARRKR